MPDSEPLEIEAANARRVHVAAAQPLAKLRVQSWYGATNVPLLSIPLGSSGDGEVRVLRIGPSEWLAVSEALDAAGLARQVLAKLSAAGAAGGSSGAGAAAGCSTGAGAAADSSAGAAAICFRFFLIKLRTVSDGCAPFDIQCSIRSSFNVLL